MYLSKFKGVITIMHDNFEHDHEHTHEHTHEHEHEHTHEHEHDITQAGNKDERTLQILLEHWVDHNKSHEETFQEWTLKAKTLGKQQTSQCIEKAIEYMKMADDMLVEARKNM